MTPRQRLNAKLAETHIADALQALDDAVLTYEDAARAIMLLKRATEVTKQAVALGATQEQLAPVAEATNEALLVFQCRGWA